MVENSNIKIQKAKSSLLLIGMFSVVMLFAGLTSAYIVSKGALGSSWDIIQLPKMFYLSTLTIIISSIFGYFSLSYCREDNFLMVSRYLLFTILFGVLFFLFQILGWNSLVNQNKFLSGNNVASSYLYVLTLTHLLHLVGGFIALLVLYVKSLSKKYHSSNLNPLKLGIRFWHFLGFLWIYLFIFLLLIN